MKLTDADLHLETTVGDVLDAKVLAEELLTARKILRRLEPLIVSAPDGVIIEITTKDAGDIFNYLETFDGGLIRNDT